MMPPLSQDGSDDFQTPPETLVPLLPYLRNDWTIWEPASGKGYLVQGLCQAGHNVVATDKKEGHDFLLWQPPDDWHCLVTNPPFSLKNEFLARAYDLGKPFAFLLPFTALESSPRQSLFRRNGIQVMVLDRRVEFETPKQKTSHAWFPVAWFCWGLGLPEQLTFVDMPETLNRNRGNNRGSSADRRMNMDSFVLMSEVNQKAVTYLWPPYIPYGEITVIDGDPGTNKSCITLDLAARVSTGRGMPDSTSHDASGVVFLIAEDSISKTLPLRLQASGADLARIAAIEGGVYIPSNLDLIEQQAAKIKAKMVIIDPLMAFLQPDVNSDQKVRQALTPLKQFAERLNLAVIIVRHLNKSGGGHSLYRGSGSIGIIGATRSALLVANDPEDPNMRVLCHVKSNLAPRGPSLLFEPVGHENGSVRIEWRGECEYTPPDLLKRPNNRGRKQEQAKAFLLETLAGGPIEQTVIEQKAAELGIAYRTVERAKHLLGIESRREGFGPGSMIVWALPSGQVEESCPKDQLTIYTEPMAQS